MSEWTNKDIDYLRVNYESMTKKELAEMLGKTENAIQLKANRLGLKKKEKYHYRKDYFRNITTPTQAYWLGFFYADGYISQEKGKPSTYYASIELSVKDQDHLRKFNKDIGGNVDLSYRHRESKYNGKIVKGDTCSIRLYCSEIAIDLLSHGCCKNKSLIVEKPVGVPEEYMWDFIRGYFDGNGTICKSYNKNVDKYYNRVAIETGSRAFVDWLSEYLSYNGIKNYIIKDGSSKSYKIQISAKSIDELLNKMYLNASRYLDRKYQRYIVAVYGESA